jgi:putative ubiquitin-RnfH superfamily antitoxin RatB of RatAB toxin-antitoxin module
MLSITVAYASCQKQIEIPLVVEENCSIALAIARSGILTAFTEIKLGQVAVGVFGKRATLDTILCDGDRVEIYRPLLIDPKDARRLRAKSAR